MHQLHQTGGSARYIDTHTLYDYGFKNYSIKTLAKNNDIIEHIEVSNGSKDTRNLDLFIEHDIKALVKNDEIIPEPTINLNQTISAPISANENLGTITYSINGVDYTENLLAKSNVETNDFLLLIFEILLGITIVFTLITLIFKNSKKKKKRRYKYSTNY